MEEDSACHRHRNIRGALAPVQLGVHGVPYSNSKKELFHDLSHEGNLFHEGIYSEKEVLMSKEGCVILDEREVIHTH